MHREIAAFIATWHDKPWKGGCRWALPVVPPPSTISWLRPRKEIVEHSDLASIDRTRHEQTSSFPFDTDDENSLPKSLRKSSKRWENTLKAHPNTHTHTDNHWIRAWKKKRNPLSPHQKFKHFNTEFELHILQWNDLESSRSRVARAKYGSENQWKSSAGGWQVEVSARYVAFDNFRCKFGYRLPRRREKVTLDSCVANSTSLKVLRIT